MIDPTVERMKLGLQVCMIAVFVWASIDYNRFLKLWMIGPASSRRVLIMFRLFFMACVIGGLWQVVGTVIGSGKDALFYLTSLPFAAGWFVVFFFMLTALSASIKSGEQNSRGLAPRDGPRHNSRKIAITLTTGFGMKSPVTANHDC
jgi:hypothetical protein